MPPLIEAGRGLDNRAAVEFDISGAKIGPVLRRSVYQSKLTHSRQLGHLRTETIGNPLSEPYWGMPGPECVIVRV